MTDETEVFLVRHARAGDRERWARPDHLRPLTDAGRRQAEQLVELFASRRIRQLLSSPYVRCVQTLEPLAAAQRLPIETSDDLAEGMPWEFVEKRVLECAVDGPSAICVHGDVMQLLVEDLLDRGVPLRGNVVEFRKGSTWILSVRDGTIVSARHLPQPPNRRRSLAS
jgi:8-oxo-dGTP diphosphatase